MRQLRSWSMAAACAAMIAGSGSVLAEPEGDGSPPPPPPPRHHDERGDRDKGEKGPPPHGPRHGEHGPGERRGDATRPRGERMRQRLHDAMFRDIQLTPEQAQQVKDIVKKNGDARRAWREAHGDEVRDAMRALREAKQADDPAKVDAAKAQLKALIADAPKMHGVADEIRAILTDEQKETFGRNLEEMRRRFEERGARRGPNGQDGKGGAVGPPDGARRQGPPPDEAPPPPREADDKLDM